ncbi:MAG: FMN-binding protein [Candidatus Eisenbacteria bacterium]|uniref:Ion-translocating oxidoreductase complex subunit G n=1 Tax=Eiseniibacteriota bacterium TaxID=2212470 RepID=A0A948W6I3_UNCEI|nr:FMN-binding protein [Candidatus Eisenbacteria bacterium]MBU1950230.1 FMN-binding protein [Candidatus Eisenbacteria bacterium]MBU2690686.1 FMN-binding protein [Candidatus Eisenbacteria bacterium]
MSQAGQTDATPAASQVSSLRMIMTLGLAGLFSGLMIVGMYEWTLPRITENQARALRAAVFQVVPGSSTMQKLIVQDGRLIVVGEEEAKGAAAIYAAYNADAQFLGYAIPHEGSGFQDVIKLIYGYNPAEKTVVGLQILESRETPGLGDKIIKDADFKQNFQRLSVEPEIRAVKKGAKSAANEIDAITGATISSKAVVKILNAGNATWVPLLPEPGSEPPAARGEAPAEGQAPSMNDDHPPANEGGQ